MSDDRLEEILQATGRRPRVPQDRSLRVEEAVRSEWRAGVRARRRRRRVLAGLGLAATVAAVVLGARVLRPSVPPTALAPVARVEAVADSAWSRDSAPASASALRLGDALSSGCEVATSERGRLALRFTTGHSVRLDEATQARVVSPTTIRLVAGTIYVDSRGPSGAGSGSLRIETPAGEIRDIGTQFEARLSGGSLRVRVREGTVVLDDGKASLDVGAGTEVVRDSDGVVSRRNLSPFGDEWRWAAEIAPMLRLEGRTAQEFLDWVARERGLTLRFETEALAASAPAIRLTGSIERMTLDEAIDSVLATCRMSYRIEQGELIVRPSEG